MTEPSSAAARTGPLAGVKIIDLTSVMMGPYATMILGDYGADVIKVESPEGDVMRHAAPMRHPQMGAMYLQGNRNKRSIVLDLKKAGGRDALLRLAADADVFVHNVRPAAMRRLKLGADDLLARNPRLVYASLHGFGEQGPYAGRPAYDDLIQGMTGPARADRQDHRRAALFARDHGRSHCRAQRHPCDPGGPSPPRPQRRRPVDRNPDVRNHGPVRAGRPYGRPKF
jgi:crotonobetainyl-CoA:carnitine CoA-transferase CaiB-like acyl-CoA transferase